MVTGFNRLLRG